MGNHGTDPKRRFGLMRERIEAMKEIWTEDEAAYDGEHVAFDPIWAWPKPVQTPAPADPDGRQLRRRPAARRRPRRRLDAEPGDADERSGGRIGELQRRAGEAGREPLPVTFYGVKPDPDSLAATPRPASTGRSSTCRHCRWPSSSRCSTTPRRWRSASAAEGP